MKNNIAIIIGGRPQVIKASALIKTFKRHKQNYFIIDSGQHYSNSLSGDLYNELKINTPRYTINSRSHSSIIQLTKIMRKLEKILTLEKPNQVIIFGDMNTTVAGALTANKLEIPIIHIESGMRSGAKTPEEYNRKISDYLSDVLIATDKTAQINLLKEGFSKSKIFICGDIMLESLSDHAPKDPPSNKHSLLTIHRAENTTDIDKILKLIYFAIDNSPLDQKIIFPIHPRTKKILKSRKLSSRLIITPPAGFKEIINLINQSSIVFTDSGGLQREAIWLGKPCIILRDKTEWTDSINEKRAVLYKDFKPNFKFALRKEILKYRPSEKIFEAIRKSKNF